jgi:GNAT superfamily N-acetyltransferase
LDENYTRVLTDEDLEEVNIEDVKVSRVPAEGAQEFRSWSVAGYRDGGRAEILLDTIARIAVLRADTSLYVATIDGKVAGSVAMALMKISGGKVAYFYTDSTLPEQHGRGVQAALLKARLKDARKAGYDLASFDTRPENRSCRNIERAGFGPAYTKAWCAKAHK